MIKYLFAVPTQNGFLDIYDFEGNKVDVKKPTGFLEGAVSFKVTPNLVGNEIPRVEVGYVLKFMKSEDDVQYLAPIINHIELTEEQIEERLKKYGNGHQETSMHD